NSVDVSYTIRGLVFDGTYASRTGLEGAQSASLVSITGGTNVTFDGNTFQYGPAYGIWTWRTNAPQILNSKFIEVYHPVRMDGNNAMIRANNVKTGQMNPQAVWIEQVGAQYITLDNNDIAGGVSVGDTGGDYLTITNNRINAPSVGIDFNFGCKHATVTGNTITSTASYRSNNGMYLWDKSTPDVNIQISNNAISG